MAFDFDALIDAAWAARKNAYVPYSKFAVGAALLTDSGQIFLGCNVENLSFSLTICAERVAATTAIQEGQRTFFALAIVAETDIPVMPCGACRQFLCEFNPNLRIFSQGRARIAKESQLSFLLPSPSDGILT